MNPKIFFSNLLCNQKFRIHKVLKDNGFITFVYNLFV